MSVQDESKTGDYIIPDRRPAFFWNKGLFRQSIRSSATRMKCINFVQPYTLEMIA
jgi:hypothetical protein